MNEDEPRRNPNKHRLKPSSELTNYDAQSDTWNNNSENLSELVVYCKDRKSKGTKGEPGKVNKRGWTCKCKRIHRYDVNICPVCEDHQKT